MLSLLKLLVVPLSYLIKPIAEHNEKRKKEILFFCALALYIYNNFDLCLTIYFCLIYIKCGSYLLVELMYQFIRGMSCANVTSLFSPQGQKAQ